MGQGRGPSPQPRSQVLAEEAVDPREVDREFPKWNSCNASVFTVSGPQDTLHEVTTPTGRKYPFPADNRLRTAGV